MDKEIKNNTNQKVIEFWWDQKNQVARTKIRGFQTEVEAAKKSAEEILEFFKELRAKGVRYIDSVNDITDAGISINPSVRKIYVDILKRRDLKDAIAVMFGIRSNSYRMILNIILSFSGVGIIKFFKTEEEALAWLKKARIKRDKKIMLNYGK